MAARIVTEWRAASVRYVTRATAVAGVYDYHVHSNYSDGAFLQWMVDAAAEAGLDGDYGELHPAPAFLDTLAKRGVDVTVGTDSHEPDVIAPRVDGLENELAERGLEPVTVAE